MNRYAKFAVLPLLGLAACTGSLFKSKAVPPTIYSLSVRTEPGAAAAASTGATPVPTTATPAPTTATPAPTGATPAPKDDSDAGLSVDLAVLKPRLRPGLDTDRIAILYPDRHMDYFADARWTGPLGEVVQDLALQEFRSHGHLRSVSGDSSVLASAYWLEIDVTDFQAEYLSAAAPTVHVQLLARIGKSGDRRILGSFAANAERAAAENRLTAIIDAYAHAADTALADIVAHADITLAGSSEAR